MERLPIVGVKQRGFNILTTNNVVSQQNSVRWKAEPALRRAYRQRAHEDLNSAAVAPGIHPT